MVKDMISVISGSSWRKLAKIRDRLTLSLGSVVARVYGDSVGRNECLSGDISEMTDGSVAIRHSRDNSRRPARMESINQRINRVD